MELLGFRKFLGEDNGVVFDGDFQRLFSHLRNCINGIREAHVPQRRREPDDDGIEIDRLRWCRGHRLEGGRVNRGGCRGLGIVHRGVDDEVDAAAFGIA